MEGYKVNIDIKFMEDEEEQPKKSYLVPFLNDCLPSRGDKKVRLLSKFILMSCYILFLFSVIYILNYYVESFQAEMAQAEIRHNYTVALQHKDMYVPVTQTTTIVPEDMPVTEETPVIEEVPVILEPTEAAKMLLEQNEDTVGYIKIDGLMVDSVVVQGEDNDYYLSHNFYKEEKQCGTLFVDYRATIGTNKDSQNFIIYGHNQKDGTMFGEMDYYRWNLDLWKTKNIIHFNTNYENNDYLIVASFVTNAIPEQDNGTIFEYWNYIEFNDTYKFEDWKEAVLQRTTFFTGYDFDETDEYITLSTCSTEWEPSRHVIIARKLREDEDANNIDVSGWEKNTNPRWPQIYYDCYGGDGWEADN